MNRIDYIDNSKVIAIYLVVLAHTQLYTPLTNWIYVFHMPLFFFISGFLFSYDRNPSLKEFAVKRFKQLVIPYISFNIISYIFWLSVTRYVGIEGADPVEWYSPMVNALLCNGPKMIHNVPLWFLLCLFIVELSYYILFRNKDKKIQCQLLLLFFVVGYLNYKFNPIRLPFSIGTAMVAIVFYGIGKLLQPYIHRMRFNVLFFLICFMATLIVSEYNGRINMHDNYYNNYLLFFTGAFFGIHLLMSIGYILSRVFNSSKILQYISQNTLIICSVHLLTFSFMKGIMVYVLNIPIDYLYQKILLNMVFALVSITICLPIIFIIKKYMPFLIGCKKII